MKYSDIVDTVSSGQIIYKNLNKICLCLEQLRFHCRYKHWIGNLGDMDHHIIYLEPWCLSTYQSPTAKKRWSLSTSQRLTQISRLWRWTSVMMCRNLHILTEKENALEVEGFSVKSEAHFSPEPDCIKKIWCKILKHSDLMLNFFKQSESL